MVEFRSKGPQDRMLKANVGLQKLCVVFCIKEDSFPVVVS